MFLTHLGWLMLNNYVSNVYVILQHLSWFTYVEMLCSLIIMLDYDIHYGICHIATFMNDGITLWHSSKFMSHYDIHQWSCHIMTSIRGYATFQRSPRIMLHCNFHQWLHLLCRIAMLIKGFVAFWFSLRLCWISMFLIGYDALCHSSLLSYVKWLFS